MYTYATVATNELYIIGAIRLYQRLQYLKSKYKCIIIVTDNIPKEKLTIFKKFNIPYIIKPHIQFLNQDGYYQDTLNKFHIFSLTNYNKVCFLDADSFPKYNIDNIFKYEIKKSYIFFTDNKSTNIINLYKPTGSIFLCKPDNNIYYFLLSNYIQKNYQNDEQILGKIFYDNPIIGSVDNILGTIYHFAGGPLKLWSLIDKTPKIKEIFVEKNFQDFNTYFDKNIKKLMSVNNFLIQLQDAINEL